MSLVLLVGAGLFLRTVHNLRRVETGFNARNVLLFRISPALNGYDSKKRNLTYDGIGNGSAGLRASSRSPGRIPPHVGPGVRR